MARTGENQGAAVTGMEPGKQAIRIYFDVEDVEAAGRRVVEPDDARGSGAGPEHRPVLDL
jgi:hypothetical protein